MEGEVVSAGGCGGGAEELWKSFAMSFLSSLTGAAAGVWAGRFGFPLLAAAGTVPKDFTMVSLIIGAVAGEEESGAAASSIEPNDTAEPCFAAAPTLLLGIATPSLMFMP